MIETQFKNFWAMIERDRQNNIFRAVKKEARMGGFEYQASVYGAVSDHGQLKAVRFEVFSSRRFTAHDLGQIKAFLGVAMPVGFSLALYDRVKAPWPYPIVVDGHLIPVGEGS